MSRTRNYMKGLASGYTATLATVLVGFWLTPFTLRFLDREEFAIFTLAHDMIMWLGLLDLGISAGLNVQAAQLSGRPDQERLNRLSSTAFFTQNVIVLVILLVGGALAVGFPRFFPIRPDLHNTTSTFVALLVLSSAIGFSTRTFSALLIAHQQIHIDNLVRLALLAIRTILTAVLLKLGWGLYSLAIATLVATIVTSAVAVVRTYGLLRSLKIRLHLASWDVLKNIGTLGIWFSLGSLAGIVITSADRIVTAKLISVDSVTTLSLTGRVYAMVTGLLNQIANTARPMLGQLIGQGKMDDAQRVYGELFTVSTGTALVTAFSLWAANGPFITRWVGAENFGGQLLSLALAANLICHTWNLAHRAVLSSALVVRPQTLSRIAEACINLTAAVVLSRYFGLVGIVLGTSLAAVLTSMWYLPLLAGRLFNRPWLTLAREDAIPLLVVGAGLAPVAYFAQLVGSSAGGFLGAAMAGGLTGAAGLGLLWLFAFDSTMRCRLLQVISKGARFLFASIPATPSQR